MNKKLLYIIGGALILGFLVLGASEMMKTQAPYVQTVPEVTSTAKGSSVQFLGSVVAGKTKYNAAGDELLFVMKDESGRTLPVRYKGMKPPNFDSAPKAVVRGEYDGNVLVADRVLLKCPSKYQTK